MVDWVYKSAAARLALDYLDNLQSPLSTSSTRHRPRPAAVLNLVHHGMSAPSSWLMFLSCAMRLTIYARVLRSRRLKLEMAKRSPKLEVRCAAHPFHVLCLILPILSQTP